MTQDSKSLLDRWRITQLIWTFLVLCKPYCSAFGKFLILIRPRTIIIPLPTHRLASSALRALSVDAELSPLVRRTFSLAPPDFEKGGTPYGSADANGVARLHSPASSAAAAPVNVPAYERWTSLRTEYKAATNRMLRVAVNGFMESMGVVLSVMEELDVDVLAEDT